MAEWKKVIVSGSNISELNNDLGFVASAGGGIISSSAQISALGFFDAASDITMGGDLSGTANNVTVTAVQNVALTSGEATQLANIGSTTISSTQWGYLGTMDQSVSSSAAVTFASVDTGQGANELYAMDQAVRTSDAVTFASVTSDGSIIGKVDGTTQFNFDGATGITTMGTASVSQNLTVGGDLIVNGDLTYINTTNTLVEDQFILLGSGSADSDVGIIFETAAADGAVGTAFFWDAGVSRLSYAIEVAHNSTAVTPQAYIPLVFDEDTAGHTPDTNVGNIKISGSEAYIYV